MHTQQPHKRPTTALAFAMTAAVAATTLNGKPQSQPKRNERKRKVRNERKKPWLLVFDWLNYGNNYNSTFQWVFSTPPAVVSSFVACFYSGYLIFIYLFGSFFFSFYVFLFFHRFVFLGIFFSFAACALSGTLIIPSLLDEMALMIVIMGGFRFFFFRTKETFTSPMNVPKVAFVCAKFFANRCKDVLRWSLTSFRSSQLHRTVLFLSFFTLVIFASIPFDFWSNNDLDKVKEHRGKKESTYFDVKLI